MMEKKLENAIWLKNTWSLNIIRVFNLLFTHLFHSFVLSFSNIYWAPPVRIIEDILLLCQWKKKKSICIIDLWTKLGLGMPVPYPGFPLAQQWRILLQRRRCTFDPWVRKVPRKRAWQLLTKRMQSEGCKLNFNGAKWRLQPRRQDLRYL